MGCAPSRHREEPQGSQPSKTNSVTSQQPVANASMVTTAPAKESETETAPSAKPGVAAESANKIETENTLSTKPATTEQSTTETGTAPSIKSADATESATSLSPATTTAASAPEINTATETEIASTASKFETAATKANKTTTKIETATPTANETATRIEIASIASASEPETAIINSKSASKIEAVATTTTADTTSKLKTASATEAINKTLAVETALPNTDTKTATKTETALTTTPTETASQAEPATITEANMSASVANAVAAFLDTNPNTKLEAATIPQALNTAEPGSERGNQSPNPVEITPGCETALDTPIDNTTMIETAESSVPDAFATSVTQHAVEDAADSDSIHEGDVSLDEGASKSSYSKAPSHQNLQADVTKSIILRQRKDNKTRFRRECAMIWSALGLRLDEEVHFRVVPRLPDFAAVDVHEYSRQTSRSRRPFRD